MILKKLFIYYNSFVNSYKWTETCVWLFLLCNFFSFSLTNIFLHDLFFLNSFEHSITQICHVFRWHKQVNVAPLDTMQNQYPLALTGKQCNTMNTCMNISMKYKWWYLAAINWFQNLWKIRILINNANNDLKRARHWQWILSTLRSRSVAFHISFLGTFMPFLKNYT